MSTIIENDKYHEYLKRKKEYYMKVLNRVASGEDINTEAYRSETNSIENWAEQRLFDLLNREIIGLKKLISEFQDINKHINFDNFTIV